MLLTHVIHFAPLGLANYGLCHTGEPGKEPLCKAVEGLVGRHLLDLASHHAGLEPEEIFQSGQIRYLDSFAKAVFSNCPFVGRGYASSYSILSHFIKLLVIWSSGLAPEPTYKRAKRVPRVARSRQVCRYWLWKHCLLLSILPGERATTYRRKKTLSDECLSRANSSSLSSCAFPAGPYPAVPSQLVPVQLNVRVYKRTNLRIVTDTRPTRNKADSGTRSTKDRRFSLDCDSHLKDSQLS